MEFSRQGYWSGLPFPSPGDTPNPGSWVSSLAGGFFTSWARGKALLKYRAYRNSLPGFIMCMCRLRPENLHFWQVSKSFRCCCSGHQCTKGLFPPFITVQRGDIWLGNSPGMHPSKGWLRALTSFPRSSAIPSDHRLLFCRQLVGHGSERTQGPGLFQGPGLQAGYINFAYIPLARISLTVKGNQKQSLSGCSKAKGNWLWWKYSHSGPHLSSWKSSSLPFFSAWDTVKILIDCWFWKFIDVLWPTWIYCWVLGNGDFLCGSAGKESACSADLGSIPGSRKSPGEGIVSPLQYSWASLVAQLVKNLPAMRETWVPSLGWEDPLEKGKAAHSSILAWRIPGTVQSMRLQRVGHDWTTFTHSFTGKWSWWRMLSVLPTGMETLW